MQGTATTVKARLLAAVPQFLVRDAMASAEYYRDTLGFEIEFGYGDPVFYVSVQRGGVNIHLKHVDDPKLGRSNRAAGDGSIDLYVHTENVDSLHEELVSRGAKILYAPVGKPWGLKEFEIEDNDGYILCFAEKVAM